MVVYLSLRVIQQNVLLLHLEMSIWFDYNKINGCIVLIVIVKGAVFDESEPPPQTRKSVCKGHL